MNQKITENGNVDVRGTKSRGRVIYEAKLKLLKHVVNDLKIWVSDIDCNTMAYDMAEDGDKISGFLLKIDGDMVSRYQMDKLEDAGLRIEAIYHREDGFDILVNVIAFGDQDPLDRK